MDEPLRHLSLFLTKPGTSVLGALRETSSLARHEVSLGLGAEVALFTKVNTSSIPWWIEYLDPIAEDDLVAPTSRTTSAVLVIRLAERGPNNRVVCYAFGHGRHLIDPSRIDRSFGLRVALNTVDPRGLRGLDARRQEDVVVNSRVQTSAGTDLAAFDLDEYRDIFRSAAGRTRDAFAAVLGRMVRGSVSVTFDVPIRVENLADRARELLKINKKSDYKAAFPFIDYIRPVDPEMAEVLDGRLNSELAALGDGTGTSFRSLYLASPEILDLEAVEGFVFSSERGTEKAAHPDLQLTDYIATRAHREAGLSVERARSDRVLVRREGETDTNLASVYRCLVSEVHDNGTTYQIVDGNWYALEENFVGRVRRDLGELEVAAIDFPTPGVNEDEGDWNKRAAAALGGICLDQKNVLIDGGPSQVEVCDIATSDAQLFFVKRRSTSSTLSHLWSQAIVAVQALLTDADFRADARGRIAEIDEHFIGIVSEDLERSDYTIHYVVLGVDSSDPVDGLPFFSQVALWQAWRTLRSMGVQVRIVGVPRTADA